jgi:hypothetical protein
VKTKTPILRGFAAEWWFDASESRIYTRRQRHGKRAEDRDRNDRDARDLNGTSYMNGTRNMPAEINGNGRELQAKNENGYVHASDWNGTGHVSRVKRALG